MALDKSQTSLIAKIIIILFGLVLIIGLAGPSFMGLVGLQGCTATNTGGGDSASTLDTIASRYRPVAESWEGILASDPTSATALVTLGNLHFDWANEVRQAAQTQGLPAGSDTSIVEIAISYYERALGAGASTPEVRTDLAIAYYYANQPDKAASTIEGVTAEFPDFAPAFFNGGIFYEAMGRTDDAIASFQRYLELDTEGASGNPDYAQERITALQQSGSGEGASSP